MRKFGKDKIKVIKEDLEDKEIFLIGKKIDRKECREMSVNIKEKEGS